LRQDPAVIVLTADRGIEPLTVVSYILLMNTIMDIPRMRRAPKGVRARQPAA